MSWIETFPLLLIALIVQALLFAGFELGFRIPIWMRREPANEAESGGLDHLFAAVLGLLALLLGFTFSLSLTRFEAKRDLVLQEANAIGTTWLRAQLLEEPNRGQMLGLLRDYVDARLDWSEAEHASDDLERTSALQAKLWAVTGDAMRSDSSPQIARATLEAMNQSFDMASARQAARSAHIPDRVLHVLILYALLSVVMLGYILSVSHKAHRLATGLLLVLLNLAILVILDIDRSRTGAIQVSQQPMEVLKQSLR
jgi:hypothetical protein